MNAWDQVKYIGAVNLLAACYSHVNSDLRDRIESAIADACENGRMKYFKTANGGFCIEPVFSITE